LSADGAVVLPGAPATASLARVPPRALLLALVAGLAASISLSQLTLAVLALWLAWQGRDVAARATGWPLAGPILAFAGWTLVAALASAQPVDSLREAKSLLTLAAFWIVLRALPDGAAARWFATSLFLAVTVVAVFAVVQVSTCSGVRLERVNPAWPPLIRSWLGKCGRAHGFFSIYMSLAGVLSLVLTVTLPRLRTLSAGRLWAVAGWLVGALAFGLTYVRGAWLGFLAGIVALALSLRGQAIVVAGVLALASGVLLAPGIWSRAGTIGDLSSDTARERFAMASAGLRLVAEHPILGVGPGQVKRLYPQYAPPEAVRLHTSHVHNTPLQIAAERGVVGLALWVAVFVAFFVRAGRLLRRLPAGATADRALVSGCIAAVAAFLVAGLFEYNFGDTEVLLVAMSVMALPFVIERDRARSPR
jgi:O-antigen ligase